MNDNYDIESEPHSMFSESLTSIDHCLDVQDEMIDALQLEIKELNLKIDLLKKLCKIHWDTDAFNSILEYI